MIMVSFPATYLLLLHILEHSSTTIGKLGEQQFKPGYYTYVGSARQHAYSRLLRHIKGNAAKKRWHIDYLRVISQCVTVHVFAQEQIGECQLAEELLTMSGSEVPIPRFGASDCRCPTHLHYHGERRPILRFSVEPVLVITEQEIREYSEKL